MWRGGVAVRTTGSGGRDPPSPGSIRAHRRSLFRGNVFVCVCVCLVPEMSVCVCVSGCITTATWWCYKLMLENMHRCEMCENCTRTVCVCLCVTDRQTDRHMCTHTHTHADT